jgi:hypothetical protein
MYTESYPDGNKKSRTEMEEAVAQNNWEASYIKAHQYASQEYERDSSFFEKNDIDCGDDVTESCKEYAEVSLPYLAESTQKKRQTICNYQSVRQSTRRGIAQKMQSVSGNGLEHQRI